MKLPFVIMILICRLHLKKMLSVILTGKGVSYRLSTFSNADCLRQSINQGERYALLFLDILLGDGNGLQFAKHLRKEKRSMDIIFISSSKDYAIESYDVSPLYYLLKPIQSEALESALDQFLNKTITQSICFTTSKRGLLHIYLADVKYFEIYGHEIIIHTKNGAAERCSGTLKNMEELLPSMSFIRPHRSYLVNLDQIREIFRYRIRLSSGELIPISKSLYNKVQNQFIEYASMKHAAFKSPLSTILDDKQL